jgi:hypothetical protein
MSKFHFREVQLPLSPKRFVFNKNQMPSPKGIISQAILAYNKSVSKTTLESTIQSSKQEQGVAPPSFKVTKPV